MVQKINCAFTSIHTEGQKRIILDKGLVNPKRELGKVGIRAHNCLTKLFFRTIKVSALNKDNRKFETLNLNRNSAIEWINYQIAPSQKLSKSASTSKIIGKINEVISQKIDWAKKQSDYHKGRPSRTALHPLFDKIIGFFGNLYWNIALTSWTFFRSRFALVTSEKTRFYASQVRANCVFFKASEKVPAYRNFLSKRKTSPKKFADIPVTDKDNYVKQYPLPQTMVGGKVPKAGQVDTSTGTSGKPTMWVRGKHERNTVKTLLNFAAKVVVRNKPLFFINAFALGPWATGITTASALVDRAITFNPGPDADKILDFLENFPPEAHPDRIYVIAGYPPFMKLLVEKAKERKIDLNRFPLKAVVGGEACSDLLRDSIMRKQGRQGFEEVYSSYGASDLDINIGYESPFELQLREACRQNPEMAAELYGDAEPLPMIFHYDPMNYYIETNENQNLIFTCVRDDRCSPRIRYNLKDRGKVLPMSDVQAILKKYNIKITPPNTNLPLLFIWGREGTVNYRGAKVPHEHLQEAIEKVPSLRGVVNNYAFNTSIGRDGHPIVEIWLEFKQNNPLPNNAAEVRQQLLEQLKVINQDFRFQMTRAPAEAHPQLKFFAHGTAGYMSNQDPQRKKKYVLENGK